MSDQVYFAASDGRIKIGTTKRVKQRITSISSHLKEPMELIGYVPGNRELEHAIHKKLKAYRHKGEWFLDCEETRRFIRNIILNGPDEIGFKPSIRHPLHHNRTNSTPQTDEEWFVMFRKLVAMMWPHDGIRQLMAFSEQPEEVCTRWLDGKEMPSLLIRQAFAAQLLSWIFSHKRS